MLESNPRSVKLFLERQDLRATEDLIMCATGPGYSFKDNTHVSNLSNIESDDSNLLITILCPRQ